MNELTCECGFKMKSFRDREVCEKCKKVIILKENTPLETVPYRELDADVD